MRVVDAVSDAGLVFAVADGLDEFGFEFLFAHGVLVVELEPLEGILDLVLLVAGRHPLTEEVIDLGVDFLLIISD